MIDFTSDSQTIDLGFWEVIPIYQFLLKILYLFGVDIMKLLSGRGKPSLDLTYIIVLAREV